MIFLVTDNNSVLRLLFLAFSYAHAKSSPSGSYMAMLRESETTQLKKLGSCMAMLRESETTQLKKLA